MSKSKKVKFGMRVDPDATHPTLDVHGKTITLTTRTKQVPQEQGDDTFVKIGRKDPAKVFGREIHGTHITVGVDNEWIICELKVFGLKVPAPEESPVPPPQETVGS